MPSYPTGPPTYLTGKSRPIEWHADLYCEIKGSWGWNRNSGYGYAITPIQNGPTHTVYDSGGPIGGPAATNGYVDGTYPFVNLLLFSYEIWDSSYCDYLGPIVAQVLNVRNECTISNFAPGHDITDPEPIPQTYTYTTTATLGFGYVDSAPTTSATGGPAGPYPSGFREYFVVLGSITSSNTVSNTVPIGTQTPPPPHEFDWLGPETADTSWTPFHFTLSGTLDYASKLHEVFDPVSGEFFEVQKPGDAETLTLTRQGGATWQLINRTITSYAAFGGGTQTTDGGSGLPPPLGLYFGQATAHSINMVVGADGGTGPSGGGLDGSDVEDWYTRGPRLSLGCTAYCGPKYTNAPGMVNPNVATWGVATSTPPTPVLNPGGNINDIGSYSNYQVTVSTGGGNGSSPSTVNVVLNALAADGSPEQQPLPVQVLSGSYLKNLTTSGGRATWTYTYGGWYQFRSNYPGNLEQCSTPLTDGHAQINGGSIPATSGLLAAYFKSETGGATSGFVYPPIPAATNFYAHIGAPFDAIQMSMPGALQLLHTPPQIYPQDNQQDAIPLFRLWRSNSGIGKQYQGPGNSIVPPQAMVPDSSLQASPDGQGNLRINVPAHGVYDPTTGLPIVPTTNLVVTLNFQNSSSNITNFYRFFRMRYRSIGSANQPLTVTINQFPPTVVPLTTGADGATASDGGWQTVVIDLLNYRLWDKRSATYGPTGAIRIPNALFSNQLQITGFNLGSVYEISGLEGVITKDAYAGCIGTTVFGRNQAEMGYTLFADGVPALWAYNSAQMPGPSGSGPQPYSIADYVGYTNGVYAAPWTTPTVPAPVVTITSLAPPTPNKPTVYAPLSELYQNDLWGLGIGGNGILDISQNSGGEYVSTSVPQPISLGADGNYTDTLPAQIICPSINLYNGCGDVFSLGTGAYGPSTTVRFVARARAPLLGVAYATSGTPVVTMTDKVPGASNPGVTSRGASGFFRSTGPGLLTAAAINAANGPLTDVTTKAGPKKTICFPLVTPGSETPIAPLQNVLVSSGIPGTLTNPHAFDLVGPGGIEYDTLYDGYAYLFIYSSGKQKDHGPRLLQERSSGYFAVVRADLANNAIVFQRTAVKPVPEFTADWLPQVTVFTPTASGLLSPPTGATVDNAAIMLDDSGRIYVGFEMDDSSGNGTIYECFTDDDGATWSMPVSLGAGANPVYGKTGAGGYGLRLPARFVAGASDATTGTIVVTPTAAGLAAVGGSGVPGSTDATIMQSSGGALIPLQVTSDGFDIVQAHEGPARFVLVCTVAGESALSEWACADESAWSFTRLGT